MTQALDPEVELVRLRALKDAVLARVEAQSAWSAECHRPGGCRASREEDLRLALRRAYVVEDAAIAAIAACRVGVGPR